jgi:CHAD domain-containing protein
MKASPNPRPFAARVADLLDSLDLQIRQTLKTPSADQVHDLRVAMRRFVQALVVLQSATPGVKGIEKDLKSPMKRSGEVRDLDIAMKFLAESEVESAASIIARIKQERRKAHARLKQALRQMVQRGSIAKWRSKLANPAEADPKEVIRHAMKRFFDYGDKADAARSPKKLHRLRIATKKLRYTLELDGRSHDQIQELQSNLGHIHDLDAIRQILGKHPDAKKVLHPASKKQRKRIREFRDCWKSEFAGAKNRARWKQIATEPGKPVAL